MYRTVLTQITLIPLTVKYLMSSEEVEIFRFHSIAVAFASRMGPIANIQMVSLHII